jgi:hypothetical protein
MLTPELQTAVQEALGQGGRIKHHDDDVAAYKKWREGVLRGDTLAN